MEHILKLTVEKQYLPATAGKILQLQAGLTKKQISRAKFRPEGILCNGVLCRVTKSVSAGDILSVCLEEPSQGSSHLKLPSAGLSPIRILYEDQDLLAVDKPSGIVTHPSGIHYRDTLSNQVYWYLRQKGEAVTVRSMGRLDRETSGIVVFAKNKTCAARLQLQQNTGEYRKEYLAVLSGSFPENSRHTISLPIGPDPDDPRKMKCFSQQDKLTPGTRPAVTHFQVLRSTSKWSLVSLFLETGRTHQIRIHMKTIGHPLMGDTLYGDAFSYDAPCFCRAALHAWHVSFFHPFKNKEIFIEAPLPDDFSFLEKML